MVTNSLRVPVDASGRWELLALKPENWEYLLFAAVLSAGLKDAEPKWRDYRLAVSMNIGPFVPREDLGREFSARMDVISEIVARMEALLSPENQELAFGRPGEPGDEDLIEHLANRLIDFYEKILDWTTEVRSMRLEAQSRPVREAAVAFVEQPVKAFRLFVSNYIKAIEAESIGLATEDSPVHIVLELKFDLPEHVADGFERALRLARS